MAPHRFETFRASIIRLHGLHIPVYPSADEPPLLYDYATSGFGCWLGFTVWVFHPEDSDANFSLPQECIPSSGVYPGAIHCISTLFLFKRSVLGSTRTLSTFQGLSTAFHYHRYFYATRVDYSSLNQGNSAGSPPGFSSSHPCRWHRLFPWQH